MRHRKGSSTASDLSSDDALNIATIAALADETHQPVAVVKKIFETHYARLEAKARIRTYLVLLATRKTREELVKRS